MAAAKGSTTFIRGLGVHDIQKALFFAACGAVGAFAGDLVSEPFNDSFRDGASRTEVAEAAGYWFALIGSGTALAIALGLGRYLRGRIGFDRRVALTLVVGLVAGFVAGYVGQFLYSLAHARDEFGHIAPPPEIVRILCWGIAGAILGVALGLRNPNLGLRRGTIGGGIGGLLGGVLFVAIVTSAGNVLGRFAGTAVIGGLIGLMIVLMDAALREAWLEVVYGPREKRTVSLGGQPVSVGSGRECVVYANGAASTAFTFRFEQGRILVDDAATGRTDEMKPGESRKIGDIELVVHGAGGAPATPTGTPAPSAPVPSAKARPSPPRPSPTSVPSSQPSQRPSAKASPAAPVLRMSHGGKVQLTGGQGLSDREIPGLEPGYSGGHVADVVAVTSQPGAVALRNLSHSDWKAEMPDGSSRSVGQGQAVAIVVGMRLNFGSSYGEVG